MSQVIKVYKDSRYRGKSRGVKIGEYANMRLLIGNDQISSLKIPKGCYVQLFEHSGFTGRSIFLFAGNYASLPGWNTRVASLKVGEHHADQLPMASLFPVLGVQRV